MSRGAVFLSYASQDAEAARRICEALRAVGVEVWFDLNELVGGDAWDQKIRKQIKECALFVPIVSANTQARPEGYFRLEWRLADQRTHLMGRSKTFLLPVCLDDTHDADADVPDSFVAVQWLRIPQGENTAELAQRVQQLLGATQRPNSKPSAVDRSGPELSPTVRRRFNVLWTLLTLAGVFVLVLGFRSFRRLGNDGSQPGETKTARVAITPKKLAGTSRTAGAREVGAATPEEARRFVAALQRNFLTCEPPFDREDVAKQRSAQVVAYFERLAPEQRTTATRSQRALAMARQGLAVRMSEDSGATALLDNAIADFDALIAAGDASEQTAIGLAMTLQAEAISVANTTTVTPSAATAAFDRGEALLRPRVTVPGASLAVRHHFAELLYARVERDRARSDRNRAALREARAILADAGGSSATEPELAASYAKVSSLLGSFLEAQEGETCEREALAMATAVLARSPGNATAMKAKAAAASELAKLGYLLLEPDEILDLLSAADSAWRASTRLDPENREKWFRFWLSRDRLASEFLMRGRPAEAIVKRREFVAEAKAAPLGEFLLRSEWQQIAELEAKRGNFTSSAAARNEAAKLFRGSYAMASGSAPMNQFRSAFIRGSEERMFRLYAGDYASVAREAEQDLPLLATYLQRPQTTAGDIIGVAYTAGLTRQQLGVASLMLGRFTAAEAAFRSKARGGSGDIRTLDRNDRIWLGLAIARQGRIQEASEVLDAVVDEARRWVKAQLHPTIDELEPVACGLYAQAVAQPATDDGRKRRMALLDEASAVLAQMPDDAKKLFDQRVLLDWIAAEREKGHRP